MNGIFSGNKIKGACFRGDTQGWTKPPRTSTLYMSPMPTKILYERLDEVDTSNTSQYHYGSANSEKQFKIYSANNIYEPLSAVPNYNVILYANEKITASNVSLVYDGDNLFHLEGDLSEYTIYGSKIMMDTTWRITLEDEYGNMFLTDSDSYSAGTSSIFAKVSGAGTTETLTNYKFTVSTIISDYSETINELLTMPFDITDTVEFDTPIPKRYPLILNTTTTLPNQRKTITLL